MICRQRVVVAIHEVHFNWGDLAKFFNSIYQRLTHIAERFVVPPIGCDDGAVCRLVLSIVRVEQVVAHHEQYFIELVTLGAFNECPKRALVHGDGNLHVIRTTARLNSPSQFAKVMITDIHFQHVA